MTFKNAVYLLQTLFVSMKICSVVTDIVMTLLVLAERVMFHVVILFMTRRYPLNNSNSI